MLVIVHLPESLMYKRAEERLPRWGAVIGYEGRGSQFDLLQLDSFCGGCHRAEGSLREGVRVPGDRRRSRWSWSPVGDGLGALIETRLLQTCTPIPRKAPVIRADRVKLRA